MKIYAHRGASLEAKENSLEAFQKALEIGVDGIEIDCLLTKDKIPVVTHYDDLSILKLGKGLVSKKNWEEIKDLGIPSLAQVLELVRPTKADAVLDIKQQPLMFLSSLTIAGLTQEILPAQRIILSSFYTRHLLTLRARFREMKRAIILYHPVFRLVPPLIFDKFYGVSVIHPFLKWTTTVLVQKWKQKGFEVNVWLANSPEEWEHCQKMGVDGFFTDDPRQAKLWLMKKN